MDMHSRTDSRVSVMDFMNYREFLKDAYLAAKGKNTRFSHRYIANRAGSASGGWFADVLAGRQSLRNSHVQSLAQIFELSERETEYFHWLVLFNQAETLPERNRAYKKVLSFKPTQAKLVGQDRFDYYSQWYYIAIRELLFFFEYRGNAKDLGKKLNPPIRAVEADKAVRVLQSLGFIGKDAQGRYRPIESTLKKDPSAGPLLALNYLKASMELGIEALERFPKSERDISAATLSFSPAGAAKAVQEIATLKSRLLEIQEMDDSPERVFQLNLQFFPLTQ